MSAKTLDDSAIEKKFLNAKNTQESIQTVSTWVLHCKSQHSKIVEVWLNVVKKSKLQLRLTLFYLCNEIVQTCKRKHAAVYKDSFKHVLPDATCLVRDESLRSNIERIFTVWQERCVFESDFVGELLTVLHTEPTKTPVAVATKLVADFKPSTAREVVLAMCQLEKEIETKKRKLNLVNFDELTQKHLKHLKDRTHGKQYSQQVEETYRSLSEFVSSLEDEVTLRHETIDQLEQSELFYDVQYGEAKIVTNAYKNFGTRVSNLRKRLDDVKKTLPDPLSPIPSPSIDAPSPGESLTDPTDHQVAPDNNTTQDNTEAVDMELSSDDENPGGEAYSPGAGADSPDSDPSPIDFQVHPAATNPTTVELNSVENLSSVAVNNNSSSLPAIDYGSSFLSQLSVAGQTTDGPTDSSNGSSGTINLFSMLAGLIKQQPLTADSGVRSPVTGVTPERSQSNVYVPSAPAVSQSIHGVFGVDNMQTVSTTATSSSNMSASGCVLGAMATSVADNDGYSDSSEYNADISAPMYGEPNYSVFSTAELVSPSAGSIMSTYSNIAGGTGANLVPSGKVRSLPSTGYATSLLPQLEAAVSGAVAPGASDVAISPYYGTGDEDGSTTPVQDEPPECNVETQQTSTRVAADPIALLNQLLSKGKSNTVASSNSSNFLQSLTMLTKGTAVDPPESKSSAATLAVDSPRDDIYVGGYEDSNSVSEPIVASNLDPSPPLAFKAFFTASEPRNAQLAGAVPVMSAAGNIPLAMAAASQDLLPPPPLPPIICSGSNYSSSTNVYTAPTTFRTGQDTLSGQHDEVWSDRRHMSDSGRSANFELADRIVQRAGTLASQSSGGPSVLYTTPLPHSEDVHLSSQTVNRNVTVNSEPTAANYRQTEMPPQSFSPTGSRIQYRHNEPSAALRHPGPPRGEPYSTYRPPLETVGTELRVVTDYGHASQGAEAQGPMRYPQHPGRPGNGTMSPPFRQPGDVTIDGMEFAERLRRKTSALAAPLPGDMHSPRFASEEQVHGYFDDAGGPLSHGNYDPMSRGTEMPPRAPMYHDQRDWHQNAGPGPNRHPGPPFPRPEFRHSTLPMPGDHGFCDEMPPHHELRPRFGPRLLPPPSMPQFAPRPPPPPQFQRPYYPRY